MKHRASFVPRWHAAFALLPCVASLVSHGAASAFRTSQRLPIRVEPLPREEISKRLGLRDGDGANRGSAVAPPLSIGSRPDLSYSLMGEHEVVCPMSGAHRGVLCKAVLSGPPAGDDAESIANCRDLVSQAILSGSLAASIRTRCKDGDGAYYLPFMVTLVESLMAEEMESLDLWGELVFNGGGIETNEILMDLREDEGGVGRDGEEDGSGGNHVVMLYACNTHADHNSATSDVYLLPSERSGKVWRFNVEYKIATINLREIPSFGRRDSSTPLRPDVWLKDDYF